MVLETSIIVICTLNIRLTLDLVLIIIIRRTEAVDTIKFSFFLLCSLETCPNRFCFLLHTTSSELNLKHWKHDWGKLKQSFIRKPNKGASFKLLPHTGNGNFGFLHRLWPFIYESLFICLNYVFPLFINDSEWLGGNNFQFQ